MRSIVYCLFLTVLIFAACGDRAGDSQKSKPVNTSGETKFNSKTDIVSIICNIDSLPEQGLTLVIENYVWDKFYPLAEYSLRQNQPLLHQLSENYQLGLYRLAIKEMNNSRPVYFVVNGRDKKIEINASFNSINAGVATVKPAEENFCLTELIRLHKVKTDIEDSLKKELSAVSVINPLYYTLKDSVRKKIELNNLKFYKSLDKLYADFSQTYISNVVIKMLRKQSRYETDSLFAAYETEPAMLNRHYFNSIDLSENYFAGHPVFYQSVNEYITQYAGERPDEWVNSISLMMNHITNAELKKLVSDYLVFYYLDRSQDKVAEQIAFKFIEGCTDDYIENLKKSDRYRSGPQVNSIVPMFTLPDENGKNVELNSLLKSNQLVMIYFWKSSCTFCKEQHPTIKRINELYGNKGLAILGISLDIDKISWLQTVDEHQLNWLNVCDMKGVSSPAIFEYAVKSTPSVFIVDRNGKLLAKDLTGIQLLDFFKTYYKQ